MPVLENRLAVSRSDREGVPQALFTTRIVENIGQLRDYAGQLETLARQAEEPNVFHEPWMLFPAIELFGQNTPLCFLLIFSADSTVNDGASALCGFFPMQPKSRYRSIPLVHLAFWRHPHCYLSTPLIHRDHLQPTIEAFLQWFQANKKYALLEIKQLSAHGNLHETFEKVLGATKLNYHGRDYDRAILRQENDFDTYLSTHTSAHFRKKLRRKRRKLSEQDVVGFPELKHEDELDNWISDFFLLEKSGWKGQTGTALALAKNDRRYFKVIVREAFRRGRLQMQALTLSGQTVAISVNFLAADGGFGFKMAYDEKYRTFSPGVMLDVEMIRNIHRHPRQQWLDSCSDARTTAYDGLFTGRRQIRNLTISNGKVAGDSMVRLVPYMRALKQRLSRGQNA